MFKLIPDINESFILSKVSEQEIFEKYLGINIIPGEKFCSPLRDDKNPSCRIQRSKNGTLYYKDWSGHFMGSCFDLVKFIYNCSFYEACKIIAKDFNLIDGISTGKRFKRKPKENLFKIPERAKIEYKWRKYKNSDIKYWSSFGISLKTLKHYNVIPAQFIWVNERLIYSYSEKDPAYIYKFGVEDLKVYFPLRENFRFISNTSVLQGIDQLPESGDLLIITKSNKDIMALYEMGIYSIAPQSESSIISEKQFNELKARFKTIYSLYDFDLAGIKSANKMKRLYGIVPLFYTNGRFRSIDYGGKDTTDIIKNKSFEEAEKITKNLINNGRNRRTTAML